MSVNVHKCLVFPMLLQYYVDERLEEPPIKDYGYYLHNGRIAIQNNGRPTNGIKGLFAFHAHPHADLITATTDYMHAFYNVIRDILKSLQPTNSGDTLLGKNNNRTYKDSVIEACKEDGFHKKLYTAPTESFAPGWVFAKADCITSNKRMNTIIGPPGTMRIKDVMKAGKGDNTHDTLEWAFTYARWCWRGLGDRIYVENILEIFDVLCIMTASTLKIDTVRL